MMDSTISTAKPTRGTCIIPGCTGAERRLVESLSYHRLPQRNHYYLTKAKWVEIIRGARGPEWVDEPKDKVCSRHFTPEDFIPKWVVERRALQPQAFPTLFIPDYNNKTPTTLYCLICTRPMIRESVDPVEIKNRQYIFPEFCQLLGIPEEDSDTFTKEYDFSKEIPYCKDCSDLPATLVAKSESKDELEEKILMMQISLCNMLKDFSELSKEMEDMIQRVRYLVAESHPKSLIARATDSHDRNERLRTLILELPPVETRKATSRAHRKAKNHRWTETELIESYPQNFLAPLTVNPTVLTPEKEFYNKNYFNFDQMEEAEEAILSTDDFCINPDTNFDNPIEDNDNLLDPLGNLPDNSFVPDLEEIKLRTLVEHSYAAKTIKIKKPPPIKRQMIFEPRGNTLKCIKYLGEMETSREGKLSFKGIEIIKNETDRASSYKCSQCGHSESSRVNTHYSNVLANLEMRKHVQQKHLGGYPCNLCSKGPYRSWSNYLLHHAIHFKTDRCEICDKPFVSHKSTVFRVHTWSHKSQDEKQQALESGIKAPCLPKPKKKSGCNHQCFQCGKLFKKGSLKYHEETHKDKKQREKEKIPCRICKMLISPIHMDSHIRLMHLNVHKAACIPKYECSVCRQKFYSEKVMNAHIRHFHSKPFKCNLLDCKKTFVSSRLLNRHKRKHRVGTPFECTVCSATFVLSKHLAMHRTIKGHTPTTTSTS